MVFFSDPSKAPEIWPPTEPETEQIAEFPNPPYNKQFELFETED